MADTVAATECWACGAAGARADRELLRCPACGFAFAPQLPDASAEIYDDAYFEGYAGEGYADEAQRRHEASVRLAWLHRHRRPPGRLLEIGSATGYFVAAAGAAGWDAHGIEPAPGPAREARERLGVDVEVGTVEQAALAPGAHAAVCAFHVVEHIREPLDALVRVRATLAPGGVLIVEVPNAGSVLARKHGWDWPCLGLPHHVNQFGPPSLRALLERAGFERVSTTTLPFSAYYRRAMALQPRHVAHRALLSFRLRGALGPTHPWKHELLRAVAWSPVEEPWHARMRP